MSYLDDFTQGRIDALHKKLKELESGDALNPPTGIRKSRRSVTSLRRATRYRWFFSVAMQHRERHSRQVNIGNDERDMDSLAKAFHKAKGIRRGSLLESIGNLLRYLADPTTERPYQVDMEIERLERLLAEIDTGTPLKPANGMPLYAYEENGQKVWRYHVYSPNTNHKPQKSTVYVGTESTWENHLKDAFDKARTLRKNYLLDALKSLKGGKDA